MKFNGLVQQVNQLVSNYMSMDIRLPRWPYVVALVTTLTVAPTAISSVRDAASNFVNNTKEELVEIINQLMSQNEQTSKEKNALEKERRELEERLMSLGVVPDKDPCDIGITHKSRYFFGLIPGSTYEVSMDKLLEELGDKYGKIAFNQIQFYAPDRMAYTFTPRNGGTIRILNYKGNEITPYDPAKGNKRKKDTGPVTAQKNGSLRFKPTWKMPDKGSSHAGRAPFYPIDPDTGRTPNQYTVEYRGPNGDVDYIHLCVIRTSREQEVGIIAAVGGVVIGSELFPETKTLQDVIGVPPGRGPGTGPR